MDAGTKPEKTIEDAVKNLKIDLPSKASSTNMSGPKDGNPSDATSCISSVDATSSIRGSEVDQEAMMGEQGMYYYGYCYPGFNGSFGEWGDQSCFVGTDGLEVEPPVIQADNGSLLYYLPSFQPGCTPPYSPILPGAVIGVDGQYLGPQSYYPSPIFHHPHASPGLFPQSVAYGPEVIHAYPWDSSLLFADGLHGHGLGGDPTTPNPKSSFCSQSHILASPKTLLPSKSTTSEAKGSSLAFDPAPTPAVPRQSLNSVNKGAAAVLSKDYFPINKISSYTDQGKGGLLYPNSHINVKENGRSWVGTEKVKARNKLRGLGFDLLNEQNRGPRTKSAENTWTSGVGPAEAFHGGENDKSSTSIATVRNDMYNLPDFPTKYDHALFFVIKSYSEDDIHKSIKYNVWASTPNGNKKLDNAFQVAQEKMVDKSSKCPVFLFFSVNASGQFCGVAEMIGRVDFSKNMDFWQQDKWNGFFPVKWHIIKDIPNPQFRHVILENNENKPVTNSRDTQEVKFPQGTVMLNIFKSYSSKTSILDDFDLYENRQRAMQDKRSKPPTPKLEHLPPKAGDLKPIVSSLQSMELEDGKAKEGLPAADAAKE